MGEGGALAINRSDLIERAEILREKGTNRSRFKDFYITDRNMCGIYVPEKMKNEFPILGKLTAADAPLCTYDLTIGRYEIH